MQYCFELNVSVHMYILYITYLLQKYSKSQHKNQAFYINLDTMHPTNNFAYFPAATDLIFMRIFHLILWQSIWYRFSNYFWDNVFDADFPISFVTVYFMQIFQLVLWQCNWCRFSNYFCDSVFDADFPIIFVTV